MLRLTSETAPETSRCDNASPSKRPSRILTGPAPDGVTVDRLGGVEAVAAILTSRTKTLILAVMEV